MHRSSKAGSSAGRDFSSFTDPTARNGVGDRNLLEDENDKMTSLLGNKITALKSLTIDIGNEVRNQNRLLSEMDSDMESSTGFLGNAMTHLKRIQRAGNGSFIWKLLAFIFVFLLIVYVIFKFK